MKITKEIRKYILEISEAELWGIRQGLHRLQNWRDIQEPDMQRIGKLLNALPSPPNEHTWQDLDQDNQL